MANSLPLLYLDSSVPSAYYNDHDPERQIITQRIWHSKLPSYRPVISNITQRELGATKNRKRRKKLRRLVQHMRALLLTPECIALASEYLRSMNMTTNDAFHVAIASTYVCEILLSWNFTHLVNYSNKQKVNEINLAKGCRPIAIISPKEL
jgi:predicted nucleic acid-binding protein